MYRTPAAFRTEKRKKEADKEEKKEATQIAAFLFAE
jgi:hypothetical protein